MLDEPIREAQVCETKPDDILISKNSIEAVPHDLATGIDLFGSKVDVTTPQVTGNLSKQQENLKSDEMSDYDVIMRSERNITGNLTEKNIEMNADLPRDDSISDTTKIINIQSAKVS